MSIGHTWISARLTHYSPERSGHLSLLCLAEPVVPRLQPGPHPLQILLEPGPGRVPAQAAVLDHGVEREQEGGRVRVLVMLNDELGRNLGHNLKSPYQIFLLSCQSLSNLSSGLKAQNLLAGNPALNVDEIHPVPQDLRTDHLVPLGDQQIVEALVPKKTPREETSGRNCTVQGSFPVIDRCRVQIRSGGYKQINYLNGCDKFDTTLKFYRIV